MPVGSTLEALLLSLKARVGQSTRASVGTDYNEKLKVYLRQSQNRLYERYAWPRLVTIGTILTQNGDRYYDVPATTNLDRIIDLAYYWNGEPQCVERGIDFEHYASRDSDLDERSDPILAWDVRWTGVKTQIEMWPIPATDNQAFRIKSMRPLRPLVAESDVCDLDDDLIVYHASAEILARQGSKDADLELRQAEKHLSHIRGNSQAASKTIVYGGRNDEGRRRHQTVIHVSAPSS